MKDIKELADSEFYEHAEPAGVFETDAFMWLKDNVTESQMKVILSWGRTVWGLATQRGYDEGCNVERDKNQHDIEALNNMIKMLAKKNYNIDVEKE